MTTGRATALLLVGGVCGLAWAAGLRGMMAELTGTVANVDWELTFGWILAPGVIVGLLLGWAEHRRRSGLTRGRRWFILSPLVFAGVLFSEPTDMGGILKEGGGGGALAVAVVGVAGGYALAGRGPIWARLAAGLVALVPIPGWALTATDVGGPGLALSTPRGAWVAIYFYSFLAVLACACTIPHRRTPPAAQEAALKESRATHMSRASSEEAMRLR